MRLKSICLASISGALLFSGVLQAEEGDAVRGESLGWSCMGCHAVESARNSYPSYRVPMLGGQNELYLYQSLVAYRDGQREHSTMQAQVRSLSDQDLRDLAAFFAGDND